MGDNGKYNKLKCRETLYKKSLCMGQALIRVSHINKGSKNPGDPVPF